MYASNIDKSGKVHKGKYVRAGECVFPFRYKNKLYNKCLDTGKGPWCATSVKSKKAIDTWGYCVDDDVVKAAMNLKRIGRNKSNNVVSNIKKSKRKKSNNVVSNTKKKASLMRKEFLKLSKKYQKHKANQIIKKKMARKIKSNNLRNTIRKIKSKKNKNKK